MGPQYITYYILYTCQTLVERSVANGQVSDNDEDFDPQRFFLMRTIQDDVHQEGSNVLDRDRNTHQTQGSTSHTLP